VVSAVSRCLAHITEFEAEKFLALTATEIVSTKASLEAALDAYYDQLSTTSFEVPPRDEEKVSSLRLKMFLETIHKKPLQDIPEDGEAVTAHQASYSLVLRNFVVLNYLIDFLASSLAPQPPLNRPFLHQASAEVLANLKLVEIVRSIVEDLYLPSQVTKDTKSFKYALLNANMIE